VLVLPDDRYMVKSRLNWKLKISNAADNADITQAQARNSRHSRMQEVNSLCTDSRPLLANTVLCYSTQYSLLVLSPVHASNNVEATFDFVERIVRLVAFDNVASTLLLVWMGLYVWLMLLFFHLFNALI